MEVVTIMIFAFAAAFLFSISGVAFSKNKDGWGLLYFLFGFMFLIFFGLATEGGSKGQPLTKISGGKYDVVSVYDTLETISLWIEKRENETKKHLLFYQFPREAFAGHIGEDAKYLVVTEADGFKKLQLQ